MPNKVQNELENEKKEVIMDRNGQNLTKEFEKVKKEKNRIDTLDITNRNKFNENKEQKLNELFKLMQESGVDLSDRNSINEFLNNLEQENPDMKDIFEDAFNRLTGEELQSEEAVIAPEEVGVNEDEEIIAPVI